MGIMKANIDDAAEILAVQKVSFYEQGLLARNFKIRPLLTTLEEIQQNFDKYLYLKAVHENRIIGSIRGSEKEQTCFIENVIVLPEFQNQGVGKQMMNALEGYFEQVRRYELFTAFHSIKNVKFYEKLGYKIFREQQPIETEPLLVFMEKVNQAG